MPGGELSRAGIRVSSAPLTTAESLLRQAADWRVLPCAWGGPVGTARIRLAPEDFQVVELPLVSPAGEGEHSWLYVRKRDSNTQWVARQLARHAGVAVSAVSYAGLKDRNAVTEQWFSVHLPGRPDPDWQTLGGDAFQVLDAVRHGRKLKTGTLRGNRFRLWLRGVTAPVDQLEERLRQVSVGGFPNYFGAQRFGRDGGNLEAAARLLLRPKTRLARHQRGLYLSAARGALFNRVLAARVADGCWNSALAGDALQLAGRSACFVAEEVDEALLNRLETLEVHPTGPLCGAGEALVSGVAASYEDRQLQPCRAWVDALRRLRVTAARRALRVVPGELSWATEGQGDWRLEFLLAAGAYATSLLKELVRVETDG